MVTPGSMAEVYSDYFEMARGVVTFSPTGSAI